MAAHVRLVTLGLGIVVGVQLAGARGLAHHAFAAEFDANQPITLEGALVRVEWVNPHAWLYIEVTDEDGNTTRWNIEMGTPNSLIRRGVTEDHLPIGSIVTVDGYRAKDGSTTANSQSVTLPDGRGFYTGSPGTGAPGGPTRTTR